MIKEKLLSKEILKEVLKMPIRYFFLAIKPKNRVVGTAEKLSSKGSIEKVKQQEDLIYKVQTNEYWETADLFEHEKVREAFRDLIKFIDFASASILSAVSV